MQDLHGAAEDLENTLPIGIVHSLANDDEQVHLLFLVNCKKCILHKLSYQYLVV